MVYLYIGLFILLFLLLEGMIRIARRMKNGDSFSKPWIQPSTKLLSYERHPYTLYAKKPNSGGRFPSNSMGYAGKREFSKERTANSIRIYCAGGSTTELHVPEQGPDSSWPGKLQDILEGRFHDLTIECINAGVAGYTSAESLGDYLFRGIDFKPDILLIYHNVNDAWTCQMVDGFKSDYSHARRPKQWDMGWVNRIPQIPFLASYQSLRDLVTRRYGKANGLIHWISDLPWRTTSIYNPRAVEAFQRNIISLVSAAHVWSCVPVLIKWECDWTARQVPEYLEKHEAAVNTYFEFLHANNKALECVMSQCPYCYYLDVGPFEPAHFSDAIHFSASGLYEMARRVAKRIEPIIESITDSREAPRSAGKVLSKS